MKQPSVFVLCHETMLGSDVPLSLSQLEECALQLASNGNYLDLDSSLAEQRDDLEQLYEDVE